MADYHKEPMVTAVEVTPRDSRAFLGGLALTAALIAAALIGLSIYSNHYGYFGRSGQFAFYNDRLSKAEFLAKVPSFGLPTAYIIGSSNAMPILPQSVDRLFGVRSFNLGSFWGRAEDAWAWTNFIVNDLKQRPKLVLLGIEPWTFADDNRGPPLLAMYQRRLITTPQLAQYLPHYGEAKAYTSAVLDSLTIENARLTLQMFSRYKGERVATRPFWEQGFHEDGSSKSYGRVDPKPFLPAEVNDQYELFLRAKPDDAALASLSAPRRQMVEAWHLRLDAIVNFLPGDRMSAERLDLFEQTLALLQANDIPVAILMMPTHPYYYDMLVHYTKHIQHLDNLRRRLEGVKGKYRNIVAVVDGSHVARFGGDPRAFHDHYHMTPINTDRLLAKLKDAMTAAQGDKR